jgi:transposase
VLIAVCLSRKNQSRLARRTWVMLMGSSLACCAASAAMLMASRGTSTQLMPLIQAVPPVQGRRGRPRRRPDTVFADRAYDHDKYRNQVQVVGITSIIARGPTEHGSGLGKYRWVVEQAFALLHWFRRLRIRWEIRDGIHEAFLRLACAIICFRRIVNLQLC